MSSAVILLHIKLTSKAGLEEGRANDGFLRSATASSKRSDLPPFAHLTHHPSMKISAREQPLGLFARVHGAGALCV
jgi:hypothetical protein